MVWEIELRVARASLAQARRRCNQDHVIYGPGHSDRDLKLRLAAALRRVRYLETMLSA
jgi:hypothetical protein